jgi:hypothetical protein
MTDVDDWHDPTYDDYEPDPSDYEEARANEEYWEHRDTEHGGGECDCPQTPLGAGDPDQPYATEPPF